MHAQPPSGTRCVIFFLQPSMCARAGKALTGLCGCAGLSEPSLWVQNPLEFIKKRGRSFLNESRLKEKPWPKV